MGAEETERSALVFDPDLSVKARRRLVLKLWFEIGESESVIDLADLDEPFRMLLFRAQRAISSALNSGVYVADVQSRNVGETVLRRRMGDRHCLARPGSRSPPATPTTCHQRNGCCTSSPTASAGTPRSPRPEPAASGQPPGGLSATGRAA